MAHPTRPDQPDKPVPFTSNLAERAAKYQQEVEEVVCKVGEHPLYELKRSCSLKALKDRIEFVKDVQSIATSRIETEKFLVVGADASSKSFVPVKNLSEFDEASVRQLLEKHLNPVPEFELFQMVSGENPFVLLVIPKQKTRRIVSKVTVEDASDLKPRILIREGDLWTKGTSTGKRLAKNEDWDEIYDERIELETERRTRQRTAHALDLAIARERTRPGTSVSAPPSYFTDEEFQAVMEDLCSGQHVAKFKILLERLRDDLVEGWHSIGGYENGLRPFEMFPANDPLTKEEIREHLKNVFRPAMHWLTLAGIHVVKNSGPVLFLSLVTDLLKEVFETSTRLLALRAFTPYGATVSSIEEHTSHTVPALESLITLHLIGAYVAKRRRFEYMRALFRGNVHRATMSPTSEEPKLPMAFWPMGMGQGEPHDLRFRAGRIDFCVARAKSDSAYQKTFGTVAAATEALCQYEFCLELNSYMAVPKEADKAADYVRKTYPDMSFYFWPSLIAFPLEYVSSLALTILKEIKQNKPNTLKHILFDPELVVFLTRPAGEASFLEFLDSLVREQASLFAELRRFPPITNWPKEIGTGLKELRQTKSTPT